MKTKRPSPLAAPIKQNAKPARGRSAAQREKEAQLWSAYSADPSDANRNAIWVHYQRLVETLATQLGRKLPASVEFDELKAEGNIGLLRAIELFEPARGLSFSTYATVRIRGAMVDAIRAQDFIPRLARWRFKRYQRAFDALVSKLHRNPTDKELCRHLQTSKSELARMRASDPQHMPYLVSIEDLYFSGDGDRRHDSLRCALLEDTRAEDPGRMFDVPNVDEILRYFPAGQDRQFARLRYVNGLTLAEIGRRWDLTESRMSQIASRALANARRAARVDFNPHPRRQSDGKSNPMHRFRTRRACPAA